MELVYHLIKFYIFSIMIISATSISMCFFSDKNINSKVEAVCYDVLKINKIFKAINQFI